MKMRQGTDREVEAVSEDVEEGANGQGGNVRSVRQTARSAGARFTERPLHRSVTDSRFTPGNRRVLIMDITKRIRSNCLPTTGRPQIRWIVVLTDLGTDNCHV